MIRAHYQHLALRVDALQLRERVLLLITSVVLLFFAADSMGFQPVIKKQESLLAEINEKELKLDVLRAQFSLFYREPDDEQTNPLALLHQELSIFAQKLDSQLGSLLSPDKATQILEQVVSDDGGLSLNAVSTRLIPQTSVETDTELGAAVEGINRYELKMQLEGNYLETLQYLRALEALPWKFFWSDIKFAVTEHPNASLDLEIYTLGQSEI